MKIKIERPAGAGWLALLGGGEFSFGDTLEADRAWLARAPEGTVGFLPTASGSTDYGRHFAAYLAETFERRVETVPVYRRRDAKRARNLERIGGCAALYLGGGVADELLEVLGGSPAAEALAGRLRAGATVAAIAAAAQALGRVVRSLRGGGLAPGLSWLPSAAIETNFDPGHDRRLRQLASGAGVELALGIAAGSALLLGPEGAAVTVGSVFGLRGAEADLEVLQP